MKKIFFKTLLNKGAKGDKGDKGQSYKIPEGAILAYDGIVTPEGYEELDVEEHYTTKEVTEIGVYKASDDGVDGFTEFTVNIEVNYNWYYNEDKTLVVREKISDGSFRWYFNFYDVKWSQNPWNSIPSNLQRFTMNRVLAYAIKDDYTYITNQIGFWDNAIRMWNINKTNNEIGVVHGIIESYYTGEDNSYKWEEPTFDPTNG